MDTIKEHTNSSWCSERKHAHVEFKKNLLGAYCLN